MKVNNVVVKEDGDWFECPHCMEQDCPLLRWMRYCPICARELDMEEEAP